MLGQYSDLKDIIARVGPKRLSPEDCLVVARARRLARFLTPPFFPTGQLTGLKGKLASLADAIAGWKRFLHDELKDLPERRAP